MASSSSAPMRRNGSTPKRPTSPTITSYTNQQQRDSYSFLASLLPTPLETLLLATYPSTLLLGSLFSFLDPSARHAPYNPITQSHPPSEAPSYFARKSNLFNVLFVKIAWFWVTLAFFLFLILHSSTGPSRGLVLTPRRLRGTLRWGLITLWWGAVTQWFFGPGLVDRGFKITGGACQLASAMEGTGGTKEFVTGQACKAVGGQWRGGHDISGHVFILVLGSLFLALEVLPALVGAKGLREERMVVGRDGNVGRAERESVEDGEEEEAGWKTGTGAPLVVAGLSWWMLLMTAAYFHTWFEKASPPFIYHGTSDADME
ncbi:MAG: hypothetical protein ALECFALPRED_002996 [Alectoria fallacina]|uniref:Uncharacterized protein n=1 Tax=Alectoria fallacina TaxID=1903189 RepID=A0A8H3EFS5_9LECA|nr:MAG: hypothetical protein ALECFALPRED_002996 [Alectoria fallacina]